MPERAGRMLLVLATLVIITSIILVVAWRGVARMVVPEEGKMGLKASGYVDTWGQDPARDAVNSVRIGGIGSTSFGKELRVKVMDRKGRSVLDRLSWKIERQESPELRLAAPLPSNSIGAVLIAIE